MKVVCKGDILKKIQREFDVIDSNADITLERIILSSFELKQLRNCVPDLPEFGFIEDGKTFGCKTILLNHEVILELEEN